jgi:DNA-binding transcriptional MerR regulator
MKNIWTKKEIADRFAHAGVSLRTIQYYIDEGLIIPEVHHTTGRGKRRLFSSWNIAQILLIKILSRHGVKLEDIKKIINMIQLATSPNYDAGENGHKYIILFDIDTDHYRLEVTSTSGDKCLELDMANADGDPEYSGRYTTAITIDITSLLEEVGII